MEKKVSKEMKGSVTKKMVLPPPPLPPSWLAKPVKVRSVTRDEIDRFWRKKKIEEEDHLLAAIKAAARIRASRLTGEEYRRFEEELMEEDNEDKNAEKNKNGDVNKEIRVGIKDWWTKSKYAYLNQPALQSMEKPKGTSTYIPTNLCFYKPHPLPNHALFGF